jgi:two-component system chemotaxis response regulator CheY
LTKAGFEIFVATSAEEAMDRLKADSSPFTLIITDQNMRGMKGTEMVKKIRENKTTIHAKTPVIMMTSEGASEFLEEVKALGISGLVLKPFNMTQIVVLVQKLHENYQRNTAPSPQPNSQPNSQKISA